MSIRVGVVGYGNLGKAVESEIKKNNDMELTAIFTRRDSIQTVGNNDIVHDFSQMREFKGKIDVMVLCLGSAKDLPKYAPIIARNFNTIDSFDTHANINKYFKNLDRINKKNETVSIMSVGWDPGIFSSTRLLMNSIFADSRVYTFWGRGVSQGHTEVLKRIKGVKNAVSYTIPKQESIDKVKNEINISLSQKEMHLRECFVVLENDTNEIRKKMGKHIRNIPNYFKNSDVKVNYITEEEFTKSHTKMPHAGVTCISAITGDNNKNTMEFRIDMDSNPEFTASIMLSYARAVKLIADEKDYGANTIYDIPLTYIARESSLDLIRKTI